MFEITCTNCHHDYDLIEIDLATDTIEEFSAASDVCPSCGSSEIVFN